MTLSRTFGLQTSPLEKKVHLRITAFLQVRLGFIGGVMSEGSQESQCLAQWDLKEAENTYLAKSGWPIFWAEIGRYGIHQTKLLKSIKKGQKAY